MKKIVVSCLLTGMMAAALQADYFSLYGIAHKDITTSYADGSLFDSSSATILTGGSVTFLYANDNSSVTISSGSVNVLMAHNTSTTAISGGTTRFLETHDTCSVAISGGSLDELWINDTSSVTVSGGKVNYLYADVLRFSGSEIVTITGGTVAKLSPSIAIEGNEPFSYEKDFTLSQWASYGVQAAPGTVGQILPNITAYDTSSITISGGNLDSLVAINHSSAIISGGNVDSLLAADSSSITLKGFDFVLGDGLTWDVDGKTILGTGLLSGKWFGENESWTIDIYQHHSTATIQAVPEPFSFALLALGGFSLRRRR